MSDLFLLAAMMIFTIVLMGAMCVVFRGWFKERERIDRESGRA
jgi:hypothetical protein